MIHYVIYEIGEEFRTVPSIDLERYIPFFIVDNDSKYPFSLSIGGYKIGALDECIISDNCIIHIYIEKNVANQKYINHFLRSTYCIEFGMLWGYQARKFGINNNNCDLLLDKFGGELRHNAIHLHNHSFFPTIQPTIYSELMDKKIIHTKFILSHDIKKYLFNIKIMDNESCYKYYCNKFKNQFKKWL